MNMVQGGMITAALDDATAMVVISAYNFEIGPLTTDLHVLFHRPVALGEAMIEVRIIKLGKKLASKVRTSLSAARKDGTPLSGYNPSTSALLNKYIAHK